MFLEISNIKKGFGEGESRVEVLKGIDIAGICVVSAIMKSDNPKLAAEEIINAWRSLK